MRQIQTLYESILDKKLDKRNFIKKINALDILVKLNEKDMRPVTPMSQTPFIL